MSRVRVHGVAWRRLRWRPSGRRLVKVLDYGSLRQKKTATSYLIAAGKRTLSIDARPETWTGRSSWSHVVDRILYPS